jgi:hypothetical protein
LANITGEGGKSGMIFVKSAVVGLLAVFGAFFLMLLPVTAYLSIAYKAHTGPVAWDPISLTSSLTWLVAITIFLGGFFWEFRRARSK